jgi:methylated-DNA-protein-cysteine methyltransferase related protein
MSDFYQNVYSVVRLIPPGRVTSYGAIARYLGSAGSSRMVGWAMNLSHHQPIYVPAHRVVNRNGLLTGKIHFSTPHQMEELLQNEGVHVEDDKVLGFNTLLWDPMIELR